MHNKQKKIAVINDYSGFGRCSLAVELPIISKLKIQCCPLPTSIFSNHTGFDSFYFKDFTDYMTAYEKADIVVMLTAHDQFKTLVYDESKVILDFCGVYKRG